MLGSSLCLAQEKPKKKRPPHPRHPVTPKKKTSAIPKRAETPGTLGAVDAEAIVQIVQIVLSVLSAPNAAKKPPGRRTPPSKALTSTTGTPSHVPRAPAMQEVVHATLKMTAQRTPARKILRHALNP